MTDKSRYWSIPTGSRPPSAYPISRFRLIIFSLGQPGPGKAREYSRIREEERRFAFGEGGTRGWGGGSYIYRPLSLVRPIFPKPVNPFVTLAHPSLDSPESYIPLISSSPASPWLSACYSRHRWFTAHADRGSPGILSQWKL